MRLPHHPEPETPGPGQESVWDYPRPAICEPATRRIQIVHRGITLADSSAAWRTLETSHPPTYYLPPADIAMEWLSPNPHRSLCEWKGQAHYWNVTLASDHFAAAAWSYPAPTAAFAPIAGMIAFYPEPFERCLVDGEPITPQPGSFYGGWISRFEAGPFKGGPGSRFW